jgi:hypothetical protein
LGIQERGAVSALLQGKRRDFLLAEPSAYFRLAESTEGVFADLLYLALDPVFVSRVAEGLELDSDRIELLEPATMRRYAKPVYG